MNEQLVKLGKYFADFNFRGSRLTAKYRENWTTRKFPILRYNIIFEEKSFKRIHTKSFKLGWGEMMLKYFSIFLYI